MRRTCVPFIALTAVAAAVPVRAQTAPPVNLPATTAPMPGTTDTTGNPTGAPGAATNVTVPAVPTDVAVPPEAASTPALTLDDAIALALRQNELIAENEEGVRKARARIREIEAGGLPHLNASATVLEQKKVSSLLPFGPTDPNTGKPTLVSVVLVPGTSKTANASLTQLVDIFGAVRRAKRIASLTTRIQELNVLRSKSEVIYQTRVAYYNVLRAQGAADVAQAALTDAQAQLRLSQQFLAAGTAPQFDVTRAEVTVANQQQTLLTAQDNLALAASALNNVLGLDADAPVHIAAITEAPDRTVDIPGQTEKALESRPEVVQADLGVQANREVVGAQKLGNYPTVSVIGGYNYNFTASGFSTNKASWDYGVNVSVPLYEGGATRARVRQAESDVRTSELQRKQLRRGVTLEVRQAGLRVQEAADRFAVADKSVAMAGEALRIANVRYQSGVATQLEVTDAEANLSLARQNRNNARYDYLTARANFDAALMGRLGSAVSSAAAQDVSSSATALGNTIGSTSAVPSSNQQVSGQAGQSAGQ